MIDVAPLASFYGPLAPPPGDAFGVFLWSVLGMRTTDGRRDAALAALRKVPAMTPDSVAKTTGVSRANLEFFRTNEAEIERMSKELEAQFPKNEANAAEGEAPAE